MRTLRFLLSHPLMRHADLDDPANVTLRRRLVQEKRLLRHIYEEWYARLATAIPPGGGQILEIGGGGGFFRQICPEAIISEYFYAPGTDLAADAQTLPLTDASLKALVMSNVLHHLPKPRDFFHEAARCVRPGGVVAMVEPWVNPWSAKIYRHLHHEPFDTQAAQWELPPGGPLSGANGANPWIFFQRDRAAFEQAFPKWEVTDIIPFMPLSYLVSGGVSMRSLLPGWSYGALRAMERGWDARAGLFALIVLRRR